VNTTAFDLVSVLRKIEVVKGLSWLSSEEKSKIFKDMVLALPPQLFCRTCEPTLEIVIKHLGLNNGRTEEPAKESSKKGATASTKSSKRDGKLLFKADANGRGKSAEKAVVK